MFQIRKTMLSLLKTKTRNQNKKNKTKTKQKTKTCAMARCPVKSIPFNFPPWLYKGHGQSLFNSLIFVDSNLE